MNLNEINLNFFEIHLIPFKKINERLYIIEEEYQEIKKVNYSKIINKILELFSKNDYEYYPTYIYNLDKFNLENQLKLIKLYSILNSSIQFQFQNSKVKSDSIHDMLNYIFHINIEKFKLNNKNFNLNFNDFFESVKNEFYEYINNSEIELKDIRLMIIKTFNKISFNYPFFTMDKLRKKLIFGHFLMFDFIKKYNIDLDYDNIIKSYKDFDLSIYFPIDYRIPQALRILNIFPKKFQKTELELDEKQEEDYRFLSLYFLKKISTEIKNTKIDHNIYLDYSLFKFARQNSNKYKPHSFITISY